MKLKLKRTRLGDDSKKPKSARHRVIGRIPIESRLPLEEAVQVAVTEWMEKIEKDVRDTFDYTAIELRVVWSFNHETREHYRELIVTTEGRRSR